MYTVNNHLLKVSADDVLKSINQILVAETYINDKIRFYKSIKSPLRADKRAGCRFVVDKKNNLILFDYSRGKSYNVIQLVAEINNISFTEAKSEIIKKFMYGGVNHSVNTLKYQPREFLKIAYAAREITDEDIKFWSIGGINFTKRDFNFYNIITASKYSLNGRLISNPAYIFKQKNFTQVYRPDVKKDLEGFIGRYRSDTMLGVHAFRKFENRDYIIITKSFRDAVYIDKLGFNVCYVIKEGHNFTPEQISHLRTFKKVYVLYDNDSTGKKNANKLKELHQFIPIFYPVQKDTVDNIIVNTESYITSFLAGKIN